MGFLDKLLGREPLQQQRPQQAQPPTGQPYAVPAPRGGASSEDERAIARYKYLLRTAPPEDIERVHTEAFGKLSPEQRQMVLQRLNEDLPEGERPRSDQPADLARSATRAEMSRPGYLQGAFGGGRGGGMGMGGMIAGSMLGTIAGVVVGSALADMMLGGYDSSPEAQEAGDASADAGDTGDSGDAGGDAGDGAGDTGGDAGGSDFGDFGGGGDFGDFGGGGDFGGF
jgi:hypothetical protein